MFCKIKWLMSASLLSLAFISCEKKAIDQEDVKSILSKIEEANTNNDFKQSYSLINKMDSLYPIDLEVKKKSLELFRVIRKKEAGYILSYSIDSLEITKNELENFIKKNNIKFYNDDNNKRIYYPNNLNEIVQNNLIDRMIYPLVDEEAYLWINAVLKSTIKNNFDAIKIINKDIWQSQTIKYDDGLNTKSQIFDIWYHRIRFDIKDIEELRNFVSNYDGKTIKIEYLDTPKSILQYTLDIEKSKAFCSIINLQKLIARRNQLQYEIERSKKYLENLDNDTK